MRMVFAGYGVGVCATAVVVLQLAQNIAESINVFCIIFPPPLFFPILAF
jgi:hypothetical protein